MTPTELAELPAREALPILLEEHGGRLHGLALKLCGHPEDAEDLVQEIFLIALRKWDQFQGDSHPTTWFYTIAARACTRRRRKKSGEPQRVESLTELLPSREAQIPDPSRFADPLEKQLRRESRRAVEAAISDLPVSFRMPLVLKEIVELPIAEIAKILDLKESTVKTRVHRGRLRLRRALAEGLPKSDAPPADPSQQMCLDLLHAKQEALDRGVNFDAASSDLCDRCKSLFATLDLASDTCRSLGNGEMPEKLRGILLDAFSEKN